MKSKHLIICLITGILLITFWENSGEIRVVYPFGKTLFPPEIAPPEFRWECDSAPAQWTISISLPDKETPIEFQTSDMSWTPDNNTWEQIKKATPGKNAEITITAHTNLFGYRLTRSQGSVTFQTSTDEVGAPIFFRDVPLPFEYAVKNMDKIKWRLGDIASNEQPPVVLENIPVCGNCHSFSADGTRIGMDVDYANDKGSYVIADFDNEIMLTEDKVISWSDYQRRDDVGTYGLLSRMSPDGRYVISTVKDRSVFLFVDDIYNSQLFFPIKGILACYDTMEGEFFAFPGADDTTYVQSNPEWSPDGKDILFTRNNSVPLKKENGKYIITTEKSDKYLSREELFCYDIFRLPFNDGKGGTPVPLKGASQNGKSNYFPKYSPDGKWIVFSSKMFTPYTQFFLTHIDENGNDSPPVLLSHFTAPDRAANIPEFVNVDRDFTCCMYEMFTNDYTFFRAGLGEMDNYGNYQLAEKDFLKALEINPENIDAHTMLGKVYFEKKEYQKAEKEFSTALSLKPDDILSLNYLGLIHEKCNELADAEKDYQNAIKCNPEDFNSRHQIGYLYLKQKKFRDAERVFSEMLQICRDHSKEDVDGVTSATARDHRMRTYADMGVLYMKTNNLRSAEWAFNNVIEIAPDEIGGYMSLAQVYSIEKQYHQAISTLQKAHALHPDNQQIAALIARLNQFTN